MIRALCRSCHCCYGSYSISKAPPPPQHSSVGSESVFPEGEVITVTPCSLLCRAGLSPRGVTRSKISCFLPDSGSLGLTSSTTSSCTGCSSGPWDWSADSFFSFPRPTIFMKDRRRLVESHSLSEQFSSPLMEESLREPRVSRYFPANLDVKEETPHHI